MSSSTDKRKSTIETTNFLSGRLAQVDVERIERELKDLWRAIDGAKPEPQSDHTPVMVTEGKDAVFNESTTRPANVMRACTANIILFSEDTDAEVQASQVLDEVAIRHPSRAILAISRRSAEQRLEAWVSARCHMADQKTLKQICSEQITVRYNGEGTRELASVVSPLVIHDLPVVLWWRANRLDKGYLEPFSRLIDMLIVDSLRAADATGFIKEMSSFCAANQRKPLFDLNWGRLIPWRRAIADAFNDAAPPMSLPSLPGISKVTIAYAQEEGDRGSSNIPVQPLLLLSWLQARLQWESKSAKFAGGRFSAQFANGKKSITASIEPFTSDKLSGGSVSSVIIEAETPCDGKMIAERMIAEQRAGSPCIYVLNDSDCGTNGSEGGASSAENFVELTEARLMDFAMESLPDDAVFRQTLECTVKLVDAAK
ncbi:MAG: glucose-6-phosphate dehydrogenase assembly protein OpcA [Candidatus Melainabacteria bacterium]|nr:glucose-6-phosphate dehydrogenase assembly protein OpcA [Candidatus Melainabacteria bacterium]